jgi:small GTP-binding protein
MLDNVEDSVKVIVVGDGNVGKTSMLRRFVKGEFTDQYKKTIGAEFMEKSVFVKSRNETVTLMLWDTAGQEVFNALTAQYYRGAGAAIIAFSTTDRDSFMNVEKWKSKVESQCGAITMLLCQTKMDLGDQAVVSESEANALAAKLNLPFFRISTKNDRNVTELFEEAARRCITSGAVDGGVQDLHPQVAVRKEEKEKKEPKEEKEKEKKEKQEEAPKPISMREPPAKKEEKKKKKSSCSML